MKLQLEQLIDQSRVCWEPRPCTKVLSKGCVNLKPDELIAQPLHGILAKTEAKPIPSKHCVCVVQRQI